MYSTKDFGFMINDTIRMKTWVQALQKTVMPGSVVVDIGTGTGIAALLACQLGAARVYAIEPNPAIQVAREIAQANGYANQIHFYQELSTQITLPERADIIVADIRGVIPYFKHHIPTIVDARQRFLKPGGIQIPQQDTMFIAGLDAPDLYQQLTKPWRDNAYNLDMRAGQRIVTNTLHSGRAKPEQIFLEPQMWSILDYRTIAQSDVSAKISWTAKKQGIIHGYQVWYDTVFVDGVTLSSGPYTPAIPMYRSTVLLLSEPVKLAKDDTVTLKLEAKLIGDDYALGWNTSVQQADDTIANYKQSTLLAKPLSLEQLRKQADSYTPKLNEDGEVARFVLELMSQQIMLGEIATQLMARFPERFSKWEAALSYAGRFSQKYT